MQQSPDDFLRELGIDLPTPRVRGEGTHKPSSWVGGGKTFIFGGYVAKVIRNHCTTCEGVSEEFLGVFTEEIYARNGSRVLTQLGRGAQWPAGEEHRCEVTLKYPSYCIHCIRGLGFSKECEPPAVFALMKGLGEESS